MSVFISMHPIGYAMLLAIFTQFDFIKAIECPTVNDTKCETFWQKLFIYPGEAEKSEIF